MEEACRQAASWTRLGFPMSMAVNVSALQLAEDTFAAEVAACLADTELSPHLLCIELTETVLMHDSVRTHESLAQLRALGVKLSIDDFGTGYSSLSYLHRFQVDELKIDRSFVHELDFHSDQRVLVVAIVAMGHALGVQLVAEGVETEREAQALRDIGCDVAQGYLHGKPQPPSAITRTLRQAALASS
jgi:EAL domain-containing protein (putative c-di-GMP-specific phosphodiesterase class I)